ncbi:MAG: hypothetical protein ACKVOM_01485 [Ferruginibacter sp.]
MKNLKRFVGALATFTIISRTSTQVISSYKDEKVAVKDHKKILVLGIFQPKEQALRQETEMQLVRRLKDQGYNAACAMEDFGPKAFDKIAGNRLAAKQNLTITMLLLQQRFSIKPKKKINSSVHLLFSP